MEKRLPLPVGTVLQGRYRVVRQLGHGGFGAVYEAADDEINLSFALKETFYAADDEWRQAFRREARMLASLTHDAFPRVTHYFTENDGCFLVMELIRGEDLDKLLAARPMPFDEGHVLKWADELLDALEDLHAKGIIHRDIKPSNLRLTPKGKLKLLDFGIAKGALEGETTVLTTVGSVAAATVQYAPLEQVLRASQQAQMMLSVVSSDQVTEIMNNGTDATSDLYSLAATLYHLLTKTLPADSATRALAVWSGQHDRLIPAHQINSKVSIKVSEILWNAMRLDRRERYQSASDLRRALNEAVRTVEEIKPVPPVPIPPIPLYDPKNNPQPEPTQASPPNPETSGKNKNHLFKAALAGVLLLLAGLPIMLVLAYWLVSPLIFANNANHNAVVKNSNSLTNSNIANSNTLTNKTPIVVNPFELVRTLSGHTADVRSTAFSPDGKTLASGSTDTTIKLWDVATGNLKQTLTGHSKGVDWLVYSPDGKSIASASKDKTVKLWDAQTGSLIRTLSGHTDEVITVAYSPDGQTLASASNDDTVIVWNPTSGTIKQTLKGHRSDVWTVAFSPDGKTIASGSNDSTIKLWDAATGNLKQTLTGQGNSVRALEFSPDGGTLASGGFDNLVRFWDATTGSLKALKLDGRGFVFSVAFSPDGRTIVSTSTDNDVRLWDVATGTLNQRLMGHVGAVYAATFSPDGKMLASGGSDKTVKLWRIN